MSDFRQGFVLLDSEYCKLKVVHRVLYQDEMKDSRRLLMVLKAVGN